jgi:hypothetical protein
MAADDVTLLGMEENKVYSSPDNGGTWQRLPLALSIDTQLQCLAISGNTIYIRSETLQIRSG